MGRRRHRRTDLGRFRTDPRAYTVWVPESAVVLGDLKAGEIVEVILAEADPAAPGMTFYGIPAD